MNTLHKFSIRYFCLGSITIFGEDSVHKLVLSISLEMSLWTLLLIYQSVWTEIQKTVIFLFSVTISLHRQAAQRV